MPRQINFDTTGDDLSTLKGKSHPFRQNVKTTKPTTPDKNERPEISDSVSSDSLPGFVKRNIGQIEQTEGRL